MSGCFDSEPKCKHDWPLNMNCMNCINEQMEALERMVFRHEKKIESIEQQIDMIRGHLIV